MDVENFVIGRYPTGRPIIIREVMEIVKDAIAQDRKERIREEWTTETKEYVPVWLKTCSLEEKALASQFWWYAKDLILRDRKEREYITKEVYDAIMEQHKAMNDELLRRDRQPSLSARLERLARKAKNKSIALYYIECLGWAVTENFRVEISGRTEKAHPDAAVDAALEEAEE